MEFALKKPCSNCPFLRTPFFYLHKKRKEEIASSLLFADQLFPCHKTTNGEWDEEYEEYTEGGAEQHCSGALAVLLKEDRLFDNFPLRLAVKEKWLDTTKIDMEANTYETMQEFIDATDENGNS